nr:CHAT domain-containing protein [Prochlorococcus marinus]
MFKFFLITFIFSSNFLDFSFFKSLKADSHNSLLLEGIEKIESTDYSGALDDINDFLKQYPTNWEAYYHRGVSKNNLSDYEGAKSDFSKSIELNPNLWAPSFNGRGFSKQMLGDHNGAISDFTKSIELDPGRSYPYGARAYSKGDLGKYIEAIDDLDLAVERNSGDSYLYNLRGYYKELLNDLEGAIIDHTAAIKNNSLEAIYYQHRGLIRSKIGDLNGAVSDFKSVFNFGNENEIFLSITYLIDVYSRFGEYQEIPELLVKGKKLLNKINTNESYVSLLYAESLYNSYVGNIDKSEALLEKCLANISKEVRSNSFYYSACKNLLIGIYIDKKEFKKAKKLIDYWSAEGQFNLAYIAFMENKLPKAEKILKRIYKLQFKDSKFKEPEPYLSGMIGSALWFQGKNKESKIYHEESLKNFKKIYGDENPILIQPLINLAMVHFNDGKYEKTDFYLRKSLDLQFKFIQKQIPFLPLSKRDEFIKTLGISYPAIFSASNIHPKGKYLALYARLNRHGLLEEIERKQSEITSLQGEQKILKDEILKITNKIASITSNDKDLFNSLTTKKENLESKLYKSLPKLESKIYSIEEIANEIPKNGVLIEYQKYRPFIFENPEDALNEKNWEEPRYQALLLFPNGEVETIDLGNSSKIEKYINNALISSEEYLPDAQIMWNKVATLIIEPLEKFINDKEILYISPDAELNRIPFSAMANKKAIFLADQFELRLITTGRELVILNKKNKLEKNQSLVAADPNFDLKTNTKDEKEFNKPRKIYNQERSFDQNARIWGQLPATKKEGLFIAKEINANLLLKNEASALNIQKKESPKIIHIASHSFFLSNKEENNILSSILFSNNLNTKNTKFENPLLRSGIVLSGANFPNLNKLDDGYLTALEVSKLNWQGTELVVISGCESGIGVNKAGDGVYGLKRSIAVSGARSSMLSLWEVKDEPTAAFMKSFYKKLKSGVNRNKALFETQKEFRNHIVEAWRHPNVWAAFQLSGDWRVIN